MTTLPPHVPHGNPIPTTSGIYKITCTTTKKIYIGSAVNLYHRKIEHWSDLKRNQHHNRYLQRAWNKYGEQVFTFEVLELVLPISLTAREQYWLNTLKPFSRRGYNLAPEAGSSLGVKHTPDTLQNMRRVRLAKNADMSHRIQVQYRKCGKCPRCLNGGPGHGPYKYVYWHDETGRMRSKYLGKA